jgi:hypothetical protein
VGLADTTRVVVARRTGDILFLRQVWPHENKGGRMIDIELLIILIGSLIGFLLGTLLGWVIFHPKGWS